MVESISQTMYGDAPLSTAKHPNPDVVDGVLPNAKDAVLIGRTVTINKPRAELYSFWRDFKNLPLFMENIERVDILDDDRSHWVVSAPANKTVEWDSLITEEIPGEIIAWTSAPDASVNNSGRIEFRDAPAGRGTEVTATITYEPPCGAVGKMLAKVFQHEPNIQARRELRRFKQLMETGEISTAQPPVAAPRGNS